MISIEPEIIELPTVYTKDIEKKLVESILSAEKSITIAVAWFTNKRIKDALIEAKRRKENVAINIVVDTNTINDKYFHDYDDRFKHCGIAVHNNITGRFLHYKYMVIDNKTTLEGTYNYSNKANSNLEFISEVNSEIYADTFSRIFHFITQHGYIDQNIQLLFEYPAFAQQLFSTYYLFTKNQFIKYRNKIAHGACFTHENGMYDELTYSPGFIFNPKVEWETEIESNEFKLPIDKRTIQAWTLNRNEELIFESFREYPESYHLINDELQVNEKAVQNAFTTKIKNTHSATTLRTMIENEVNIIIEDQLWSQNFDRFLNKQIADNILDNIPDIDPGVLNQRIYGVANIAFRVS